MASYSCAPQEGHLKALLGIFCYLKKHIKFKLVLDHRLRDMEQFDFKEFDWNILAGAKNSFLTLFPIHLETLYR
jgi:hypothetical protein